MLVKKLIAHFTTLNSPKVECSYPVWEYPNGLVQVPSDSMRDWFFYDRESIEGCGLDIFQYVEEEDELELSKKDLADAWGYAVRDYGDNDEVKPLVRELLFG